MIDTILLLILIVLVIYYGEKIMGAADDLRAKLVTLNETTNEIATDVADMKARLGEGGLSPAEVEEFKTSLTDLENRLRGVAAEHTP